MAIIKTFNGVSLLKPGAYTKIIVENLSGFPLAPTGVVGIIGEAVGGKPRVLDILEKTQIQSAKSRYKSGPIADALELLVNPSKDPRVENGASTVVVYKVNNSTQSSLDLLNAGSDIVMGLKSQNYGDDENNLSALVSEGTVEDANAKILGTISEAFNLSGGGDTLVLKINGVTYTHTSTLSGAAETAAAVIADLNTGGTWAPSKPIVASPGTDATKIDIEIDVAALTTADLDYGYIEVDAVSTLDTILGLTGSNRGQKGSRVITFVKGLESETTEELGGEELMSILYTGAGTLAELTIQKTLGELKLTTAITGAAADNLDIVLEDSEGRNKFTIKELVALINSNAAYTAVAITATPDQNANQLDYYEDLEMNNVAGVLKKDIQDAIDFINTFSQFAEATRTENIYRAYVTFSTPVLFTGAGDGTATNSDWGAGLDAFKEERINIVVSLLSEDKGSVTIDSVNALVDNHVRSMWATDGRSERNAYVSKNTNKDGLKAAARSIGSQYTSIVGQQVRVLDRFSELNWQEPWAYACLCAGMQAGSPVGEPITFKLLNVNDMRVEDGSWNPKTDFAEMIKAGVTIAEPLDNAGFRTVVGNTTYGLDGNFVWNRISVVEAGGFIAYDLRTNLELVFTGTKARTGTAEAIANFIKNRFAIYLREDITVGDDENKGLGWKNLRVQVEGATAAINISATPVQGIDFILPTIYLADIRQSA